MSEHNVSLEAFEDFEYSEPVLSEEKKRELREYFEDLLLSIGDSSNGAFPFGRIVLDPCLCDEKENS